MNPASTSVNATVCPLCGEANRCAMEMEKATGEKQPPCWCTQVKFERAVLAQIPAEARRMACICRRCSTRPLQPQPPADQQAG